MSTVRVKTDAVCKCTWCKSPIRKNFFIYWCDTSYMYCWFCLEERGVCKKCKKKYIKIKKFPKNMWE